MVYGKAKKFSVKQKAMPAGAGSLAPPFNSQNGYEYNIA
jgi:hypothetical protein